jgi:hypothetical protein
MKTKILNMVQQNALIVGMWMYRTWLIAFYALRLYKLKTSLQRAILEPRKEHQAVPALDSLSDIMNLTVSHPYKADPWYYLFDFAQSPERVAWLLENEKGKDVSEIRAGFDCDEFAMGHVSRIKAALNAGKTIDFKGAIIRDAFFAAIYYRWGWKQGAHHVALVRTDSGYVCLDYAYSILRNVRADARTALNDVMMQYATEDRPAPELVVAVIQDMELKPLGILK